MGEDSKNNRGSSPGSRGAWLGLLLYGGAWLGCVLWFWLGRSSGGGGHWQAEYAHLLAPVRPGDDHITLRYAWLGETVLIDVPLPEEAGS